MDAKQQTTAVSTPPMEVEVINSDTVRQIQALARLGWGAKRIAKEVGVSRNTVRSYLRKGEGVVPFVQVRMRRRVLDATASARAVSLLKSDAQGNAVVVKRLLALEGISAGLRSVQRALQPEREAIRQAQVATMRFETAPGKQIQIDFGQKMVQFAGQPTKTKVYFFVAVLGYSRRIFVRASLNERIEEWQSGLAAAFSHFGGLPEHVLIDNPKAMVLDHNSRTREVVLNPMFAAFVGDYDVEIRACAPYRARTKGKVEAGVKYVKNNCLAGISFTSFAALEAHVAAWIADVDGRVHGTTHKIPRERFCSAERAALRPLPQRPVPARLRRLKRKVANDCLIDIDGVRYSVPHRYVREFVCAQVGDTDVNIYAGASLVATHKRTVEPHAVVKEASHYDGLLRRISTGKSETLTSPAPAPAAEGMRSLTVYDDIVQAGGAL